MSVTGSVCPAQSTCIERPGSWWIVALKSFVATYRAKKGAELRIPVFAVFTGSGDICLPGLLQGEVPVPFQPSEHRFEVRKLIAFGPGRAPVREQIAQVVVGDLLDLGSVVIPRSAKALLAREIARREQFRLEVIS